MGIGEEPRAFRRITSASPRSGISILLSNTCREKERRVTRRGSPSPRITELLSASPSALRDTDHALALRDTDHALVGEDSREILKDRRYRTDMDRTALIDLVMGQVSAAANDQVILDQKRRDKYALKSRLFADEADVVLRRKGLDAIKGSKPHVLVIGAMAGTHAALIARGFEVTATDMSPDVVGQNLGGVTVCDGTENDRLIEAADLVIITGMTLPNRTLPGLIEAAKINNTSTMIWAVTGRNFGHYYTEHGVDCVISDPSPFLLLAWSLPASGSGEENIKRKNPLAVR